MITMVVGIIEALILPPSHALRRSFVRLSESDNVEMSELFRRIKSIAAAEELEKSFVERRVRLPVIAFDALLPNQRLEGSTEDPTFGRFLRDVGLGGLFVMTSVNHSQRKLRRNGVVARIEIVDAKRANVDADFAPTSVVFSIVGKSHCRIAGPSTEMVARVGRWRRVYDPEGEESRLGWGEERFVDAPVNATSLLSDENHITDASFDTTDLLETEWSTNEIDCNITDVDNKDEALVERAEAIIPLLEKWQSLATDLQTYDNTNVVATARLVKGHPGLRIDPAALVRNVRKEIGERPTDATALALWGAALINPLPVLGVSPEIRGRVLEAPDAATRLKILEWGVKRSIANLEGTSPLI